MTKQQHYKAALYCRLSVDDGNFGGSVSIQTQKVLLEQYCKDHSITDYTFYCDDGCSGTNFDREAFQKMYGDIQSGKINLVIVKDLSRFGRNYVETGMCVREFTDNNIRFIAADDNYDSLVNGDDLLFPIKNVVNEMYARDVSKKTKAAKKAKARDGQFIGSKAPFGYKIDPADRHHLIVDELAAQVVKRIFRLAAEGIGYNKMAKMFREEKVLTPIAYFNKNNPDYFKSDYWRKEFDWHVTSIRAILDNEVYLGQLVYGKRRNKSIKSKLYEDNALGKIPDSRYELMTAEYEAEQAEIRKTLPDLAAQLDELKRGADSTAKFINVIRKYTDVEKLDAAILNELIDKIVVHHKERSDDGRTYQQIEIFYRFVGKLDATLPKAA